MYTLKKSLGQHFLQDEAVISAIINALKQYSFKQLLEVGPGGGALTQHLVHLPDVHFKAIELDKEKVDYLLKRYPPLQPNLIHQSILDADKPFEGMFTVIGNFPYNISSQIVFKMLEWRESLQVVIGMFQKEVAQRIAAKPGSKAYGIISILVQIYCEVKYLFEVDENAFNPPPKVKSAVISITPRATPLVIEKQKQFELLVKTAFNQRRKTLRNATRSLFTAEILQNPIFDKRAEQLSIEQFIELNSWIKH